MDMHESDNMVATVTSQVSDTHLYQGINVIIILLLFFMVLQQNQLCTHSKIGISHAVFSRLWLALATAEVTETTEAATKIAASDGSTEQEQCLHTHPTFTIFL